MKNPLLLLALAAVATGGCQQAAQSGPEFAAGMTRTNYSLGFKSTEAEGPAFTSASGGAPSLIDNGLDSGATVAEIDSIELAASYGLMVAERLELGTRLAFGVGGNDNLTVTDTDYDGDGFNDRALAGGVASDDDQTYWMVGGYSRYYPNWNWGVVSPWVQADFGYYVGDLSGLYWGGSLGASWFLSESTAIEGRIYGEKLSEDDDTSGVGVEFGYSIFN